MAIHSYKLARVFISLCLILSFAALSPLLAHAQEKTDPTSPEIAAQSAIVVEYPSGRILYTKNEHERMPPASLTKIMTAILALEYGSPDDVVTATPDDIVGESAMGLVAGEQQTMHNLMYGMLLPSGNDAAMTIARHIGSTVGAGITDGATDPIGRFAVMMNIRAQQLGLLDTHFLNPHGLDTEGHYSTAYDLASMSWYALHIPEFNAVVSQSSYDAPGHPLLNTNEMLTRYAGADGIKTGWTDGCGLCLVTSASRDGHRLISVVLNDSTWWSDSATILDYGFARLAADPAGTSDSVLTVSQSGVVSGILSNPGASLPLPAPLAQGGGPAVAAPETGASTDQPVVQAAPPSGTSDIASATLTQPQDNNVNLTWIATLMVLVGVGGILIMRGLGPRFKMPLPAALSNSLRRFARPTSEPADPYEYESQPVPMVRANPTNQYARRREPNLLLRPEDTQHLHIERAIALAAEGRQGSSISEFLQALKAGGPVEIGTIAEQFQLPGTAFLALARAQVAAGDPDAARQTLLHGVLVLPQDRTLRMALYRLEHQAS